MGDEDEVTMSVRVEDAYISEFSWKKKFCLLPQVSTVTARVIWLKYAYRGVVYVSIPAISLTNPIEMWHTLEEHTGWLLSQGVK